jgi:two-component system response regulator GlrR
MTNERILVIDDDESIRKIFKLNLEEEGYVVHTAETGEEALKKMDEFHYNIALVDIKLGDVDGTDLLERIQEKQPLIRKIIVTGFPSMENAIKSVNEGADGYILKPVKIDRLFRIIKEQLKKQQEEEEFSEDKMSDFIENRVKELETIKKYYRPI